MSSHAKTSPSSADRWLHCPGSITLSKGIEPGPVSFYAQEGTAAHRLAELSINKHDYDCYWALDKKINGIPVTKEMIKAVDAYLNYIVDIDLESDCIVHIEKRVTAKLVSKDLYGTADCIIEDEDNSTLHVIDYKHGQGVIVSPVENPQLVIYGLGALYHIGANQFKTICLTVVQPRSRGKAIETWKTPVNEFLNNWIPKLRKGIKRVKTKTKTYKTGDHCLWCPAKLICLERQKEAQALAKLEFSKPSELTKEQIKQVLDSADRVKEFIDAVRGYAHRVINEGGKVPGYKLVDRKSNRKWINEKDVIRKLRDRRIKNHVIFDERKIKSPAQLEKLISKDPALKRFVEKHVTRIEKGLALVPITDKRKATKSARKDFE